MDIVSIIFIAFGLAMDAFAVSISGGLAMKQLKIGKALKIAVFFGSFQAIMPVLGWLVGLNFRNLIASFDHWVVFGILSFIGGKMIYDAVKIESNKDKIDHTAMYVLLMLSVATSIDALAVGVSFAFLNISIITPIIIIGIITFFLSFLGVFIGHRLGHFFEKKIEIVGGLILIGIGIKILIEHL